MFKRLALSLAFVLGELALQSGFSNDVLGYISSGGRLKPAAPVAKAAAPAAATAVKK